MKRYKSIIFLIIAVGSVIALLLNNKAKMEAKTNNEKITDFPVTVNTVERKEVSKSLELIGTITANNDVAIVSEASGKVNRVYAKVGDYKSAGSVLFELDDELKAAAYKTAELNYEKAKKDYERFQVLYKERSITDSQIESAKLAYLSAENQYIIAKRQFNDTKIKTPISGVVTARNVDIGNFVNNNTTVANIVDISKLKVKLNVAEKDAFRLKGGDKVEVTTDVYPGAKFEGRIESISSKGDEAHTYPVEITLANSKQNPLKAGMFAKVSFTTINKSDLMVIPREALIGSIKDPKVFIVDNGTAKLKEVVIGSTYDNSLEILSGLSEGEQVVVNGQNNLKDNDKVVIKN